MANVAPKVTTNQQEILEKHLRKAVNSYNKDVIGYGECCLV